MGPPSAAIDAAIDERGVLSTGGVRILHIEDDRSFADLVATFLERERDYFEVTTETDPRAGVDRAGEADCVVCDYDMPGLNGLEVLKRVREDHPDLPFVLFTGKGSEEIASEAISNGVTDYLQKGGSEQYAVLANRIENAVARHRAERQVVRGFTAIETSHDGIALLDGDGTFIYVNEAYAGITGYDREELLGGHWNRLYPDDEASRVRKEMLPEAREEEWRGRTVYVRKDGTEVGVDHRLAYTDEGTMVCTIADVTDADAARELSLKEHAMDEAPVGIVITDPEREDNPIVYANDGFVRMTGYSREETVGRNCRFLQGKGTEREPVDRMRDTIEAGDSITVELRNYRRDGTAFWNRVTIAPLFDDGEVVNFVGIQQDVTERYRREQELRRERDFVEQALDSLTDVFYVVDTDGELSRWNDSLPETTGYTDDEIEGIRAVDFFAEEERDRVAAAIREALSEGEVTLEADFLTAAGERIPHEFTGSRLTDLAGETTGLIGIGRDLTERRRAERERKETVDALRRLYDVTTDPELGFEEKIDRILAVGNRKLGLPYGFLTRIETGEGGDGRQTIVESRGDHELLRPGESCPLSEAYCRRTIVSDEPISVRNAIEDGWEGDPAYERFELGSYVGAKVVLDDELYGTLCFASTAPREEPVTDADRMLVEVMSRWASYELERRRATEELRRQNDRLEEFASVVSHDLRNPLTVAEGRLEMAREDGDLDHLEDVAEALDRMNTLIDDLLTLAQDGTGATETDPVNLGEAVERAWRHTDTGDATLQADVGRTLRANRSGLEQLLENLFRNAVEHDSTSHRSGTHDDAVEHGGERTTLRVGASADGFYVEDDGPGIDPADRDRVFEPGYSSSPDGTGFGLSIVERVADSNGWAVRATDGSDGGARFEFTGVEFLE